MKPKIRGDRYEHVWGKGVNRLGRNSTRTVNALQDGGFVADASVLARVSTDKEAWEEYVQTTCNAHAPLYALGKLRFLQDITKNSKL